jgi:pimeloyl-ACP methyl ester carboxylesterase
MKGTRGLVLLAGLVWAFACAAQVVDLDTRPGVKLRMLVGKPAAPPSSIVILLNGGTGFVGIYDNGSMQREGNFLIRSRGVFEQLGHAVLVLDTPSDKRELRGDFRDGAEHAADLGAAVAWARQQFGKPVWLVGTSRGTHSAANGAFRLRDAQAPDGIVLTSSVLESSRFGTSEAKPVQNWDWSQVRQPVLVVHHRQDACQVCPPARLPELMARLRPQASQLLTYEGGLTRGADCEAFAYHGFNGIESQVVGDISAWIKARP